MEAVIDSVGRVVVPKPLREALGLLPGTVVDISAYCNGVQITPGGRTARLERYRSGRLVARSDSAVTDEMMFALIDASRRRLLQTSWRSTRASPYRSCSPITSITSMLPRGHTGGHCA